MEVDLAVVGGGILGLATARELLARRQGLSCSSQYSYSSRAPSTHRRAFSEPGA